MELIRIRKTVLAGLMLLFIASLLSNVIIDLSYAYGMPSSPRPEIGRIHCITVNHGYVVYVTAHEMERANFVHDKVFYVMCLSLAAFLILKTYWKSH